jgi:3-hydroxyisobutyrate dehydrogenase-like beta-hydroxyacid dehydrogenase
MEKDLRLTCTSAAEAGIELPIAESARSVFADAVVAGHGASDVSIVLELATAGRSDNESGRQLR